MANLAMRRLSTEFGEILRNSFKKLIISALTFNGTPFFYFQAEIFTAIDHLEERRRNMWKNPDKKIRKR
jgi:hypothetical protein